MREHDGKHVVRPTRKQKSSYVSDARDATLGGDETNLTMKSPFFVPAAFFPLPLVGESTTFFSESGARGVTFRVPCALSFV